MPSKIPQRIEILGCEYQIQLVDDLGDDTPDLIIEGEIDVQRKQIAISSSKGVNREAVLLHETIHGILAQSGLTHQLDEKLEESIVTAIEEGLFYAGYRRVVASDRHSKKNRASSEVLHY